MSLEECVKLSQLIVKKVQTWPSEQSTNTFITFSGLSAQLSNKIGSYNGREVGSSGSGNRSPIPPSSTFAASQVSASQLESNSPNNASCTTANESNSTLISAPISNCSTFTQTLRSPSSEQIKLSDSDDSSSALTTTNSNANSTTATTSSTTTTTTDTNNNISLEIELIAVIEKLAVQAHFLHENAVLFDYTGKQVNGYFSMLRVLQRFFEYVMYQMEKRKRKFQEFYEIACLLSKIFTSMQDYRRKYLHLRNKFDLINAHPIELCDSNGTINSDHISKLLQGDDANDSNGSSSATTTSEISSNDSEDEPDEEDDCEFDSISTDMVMLSSDLATSIESMKRLEDDGTFQMYDDDFVSNLNAPRKSPNSFGDKSEVERSVEPKRFLGGMKVSNGTMPKFFQKISDYYSRNEVKKEHNDREYGKEIRKEEYEKNQPKYSNSKRFNFRLNSLQSPTSEEASPKKSQAISQRYYKYLDSLTRKFEENFTFTSKSVESNGTSTSALSNGSSSNGKSNLMAVCEQIQREPICLNDDQPELMLEETENHEQIETDEEKEQRRIKLDEYILSKFPDSNDENHLITPPMLHFYEGFTLTLNCEKELGLIYGRVGPFWYCKSAAQIVNLVRNLIVILTSPPSKSIASLCNTDYCGRVFAHRQVNATLDSLVHGLASLEVKAYNKRYFKYLYREHVIYGKTVYMPVSSKFVIPNYGNDLKRAPEPEECLLVEQTEEPISFSSDKTSDEDKEPESLKSNGDMKEKATDVNGVDALLSKTCSQESEKEKSLRLINSRTVRCRLINYARPANEAELCPQSDRCLLFHVHGGGFVLSSPDSHELYLRDWAVKLKGIPILSVDYVLRKRYPSAPQDVLDVYLTLIDPRNQQMIIDMLGFQPERIILVGDSAGANLILSLLCCLNEIRRKNPDYADLRMPIAMLTIYGAFDIRAVMSPSKFISSIDPILHHGNIMAMIGTYAGIAQKIRKSLWSRIKNKRSSAWYRVSERELKSRFKHLSSAMENYFASPLIYPHFADFAQIPLYLVTTHLCPLVDDSVVLYKAWKGPVSFEIFDGLPHAFLNFCDRSEEAKVATDKCIEKIVEAFQTISEV